MGELALVAGLGKTGYSIVRYLQRRNRDFIVFDTRDEPPDLLTFKKTFPQVEVYCGELPGNVLASVKRVISSPGVPLTHPVMSQLASIGVPIIGDIECFVREITAPVIAITGTNGKSTVTALVGEMVHATGLSVAVAGNIGLPVLDLLDDVHAYDMFVLELSSFQLELTESLRPCAATILNISPDHLDRHCDMDAYINAKHKIYNNAQNIVYNREDRATYPAKTLALNADTISYGLDCPQVGHFGVRCYEGRDYLAFGENCLLPCSALRIPGTHNVLNALAACALVYAAGLPVESVVEVLRNFAGLPHRSQLVRMLGDVAWINDSKGTNIGATLSAIVGIGAGLSGKIVLIAGGQGKGADFTALRQVVADYVRVVVLIGEDADKIELALQDVVLVQRASSLEDAVYQAQLVVMPGDVVLLSPACASFDMFRDFNHRGEVFSAVVREL